MAKRENEFEWNQFCRLGEMIGDGMHHEEPWISREYKRLQKILIPDTPEVKEFKRKARKLRNENIDKQVKERLLTDKCSCGSEMKQTRSGSKTVKCLSCNKKWTYKSKK